MRIHFLAASCVLLGLCYSICRGGDPIAAAEGKPLADAVAVFNRQAAEDEIGRDQPALTEDETVAAILSYRPHGDERVSDDLVPTFRQIAETRSLPASASFEKMSKWQPGGRYSRDVWWVRIRIERPGGSSFAFPIRERMIRAYDEEPKDPAYGAPSEQGLRAACYFVPQQERYDFDAVVARHTIFRNDGSKPIEFYPAEEPEDDKWSVVDENGQPIATKTIRWEVPHLHVEPQKLTLKPGETVRVSYRRTVGLGHGAPADHPGCTIVRADMGQTCRVTWTTKVRLIGAGEVTLTTGELRFQIRGAQP
jgi:hypothetical protein